MQDRHLLFSLYNSAFFADVAAKNRAFRFNSSDLLMQILRDFRCNAPEDGRFPIGMDCRGRYRAHGIPCAPRGFQDIKQALKDLPRQVLDFAGFAVKKFCGSSLAMLHGY
ncbi:MAG: hypothetical protein LBK13_07945 [Spirochaetales bacterium]|jgi:hypothetical protein|nr:hypothetical protein [Spirochaetales bacterium]